MPANSKQQSWSAGKETPEHHACSLNFVEKRVLRLQKVVIARKDLASGLPAKAVAAEALQDPL